MEPCQVDHRLEAKWGWWLLLWSLHLHPLPIQKVDCSRQSQSPTIPCHPALSRQGLHLTQKTRVMCLINRNPGHHLLITALNYRYGGGLIYSMHMDFYKETIPELLIGMNLSKAKETFVVHLLVSYLLD